MSKFKIVVYSIDFGSPYEIHNKEVEASCSIEAISRAGHLVCDENPRWSILKERYFANALSMEQFDPEPEKV